MSGTRRPESGLRPDYVDLVVSNRSSRDRLAGAPTVLRDAVALVWGSGRALLTGLVVLSVASALLVLGQLVVIRELVTQILSTDEQGLSSRAVFALLAFVALTGATQGMGSISTLLQRLLAQNVLRRATADMLDVTSRVDIEAYEDDAFFGHLKRVETNGLTKPMEVVQALVQLFSGALTSLLLVGYVATVEPWLIPLLVVTALPAYLIDRHMGRSEFTFHLSQVTLVRQRDYLAYVLKARRTSRELRAFSSAGFFRRGWDELFDVYLHNLWMLTQRQIRLTVASTLVSGVLLGGVGVFVIWRVQTGAIPLAAASAAIVGLRMLSSKAQEFGKGLAGLLEARLYLHDLHQFRTLYGGRAEEVGEALPMPERITVDGVSFTYPGAARKALDGVSVEIRRGEVVALVGQNGSGKTTLSMLLAGLLSPSEGAIRWDGVELTRASRTAARRHIGVVLQDFARYERTAYDNIVLGAPKGQAVLEAAIRDAGAGYLHRLPEGLETFLSKEYAGGQDLSVGQWQRVALARAFHRDSPIIILDEPASALDAKAEHELYEFLRGLWRDRTVVLVSHRLASVRSADRIVVLDAGCVVDVGTHDELMARGGLYAEMFTLQARDYLDVPAQTAADGLSRPRG
jgi:ATP-binding cassette subfamily B protein